jgi:tRNA dimethylallyltransferase
MAVDVARALGGVEIVSCDSMAVYRGLDVVADKPPPADRAAVPHHLLDVVGTEAEFTVVSYRERAREAIASISARGCVPMLVGGSGLYFRAVVDELSFAPTSAELRRELEQRDAAELYERLRAADPAGAASLDPRNVRRVVRAVEVLELTGRRPSELRAEWESRNSPYDLRVVGLTRDRHELFAGAAERIERMLDAGLVEEVRRARERGLSRTAGQAVGVKEVVPFLEGRATLAEVRAELLRSTKAFIRRQLSWFGADERIEWLNLSELGAERAREIVVSRFAGA